MPLLSPCQLEAPFILESIPTSSLDLDTRRQRFENDLLECWWDLVVDAHVGIPVIGTIAQHGGTESARKCCRDSETARVKAHRIPCGHSMERTRRSRGGAGRLPGKGSRSGQEKPRPRHCHRRDRL